MKKLVLDTVYKYIFAVFFLIVLYLGLSNEPGMGNNFHFLIGNFYYVLLVFLAGKALVEFFVKKDEWKELFNLRLNYIWGFSFSLLNLMILFSMKGVELGEYIDLALLKLNSGVLFTAFFSKVYGYAGKTGMYVIFIPLFIFSSLVVFGKIIGYIVRFFIKLKKSDFLKNYRANLIESRIKRREKKLNNALNKAQKKKKKKFEKLSKEIDQEEIRPKFNDSLEKEDYEEYPEDENLAFDGESECAKESLDESYELQESFGEYQELSEEEAIYEEFSKGVEEEALEETEEYEEVSLEQGKLDFEEMVEEDIEEIKEETELPEELEEEKKFEFDEEEDEDNFQEESVEDEHIRFEDEEYAKEEKVEEVPKERGTFLLFHLFGSKEKDERKEKAKLLRRKRKDEEKQRKQDMKEKRKRLRDELRSRNLKSSLPEEEVFDSVLDYEYEDTFVENTESQPEGFSEDDLKNIDYSEISEGLELELSVVEEGGRLYHLVGIQSPKELSERLNLTLIKATQLAIRLNNLKIGDKNDTGIKEPQA